MAQIWYINWFTHFLQQSRIKTAVSVVKPYLNETAVIALGALQDLEELADMDIISVPPSVQGAPADVQSAPVNVLSAPVDRSSYTMYTF